MLGKPVIRGTRIPVELILRKLAEGATEADLLDAYPRLTAEDIKAAIGYAADTIAHEETVMLAPLGSVQSGKGCASWRMKAVTSQSCVLSAPQGMTFSGSRRFLKEPTTNSL